MYSSKFTFTHEDSNGTKIQLETRAISLSEILEEFQSFLKGAGFIFDGELTIEEPFEPSFSDNIDA